jgi:hypothetical protein
MVRFGNLHHLRHRHQKRPRCSNWTLGKADSVLHPGSGVDSSLLSTASSINFALFPLSFLGPAFSFLFSMCVTFTFFSAQSTIDETPMICFNVHVSSSSVTIMFEIGVSPSISSSSSSGSVFERPINNIRQVRHKYDANVVT